MCMYAQVDQRKFVDQMMEYFMVIAIFKAEKELICFKFLKINNAPSPEEKKIRNVRKNI